MELRDIEIFLTLAEELHFSRTADRLHLTTARVSQSIRKQERFVGAPLFDRTTRAVRLTPLGEQLYADLKAAYAQLQGAIETATATARGTTTLTLGVFGSQTYELVPVIDRFRARNPNCDLLFREVHFSDPFGALRAGQVDLQTCWLPVREPDLTVGPTVLTGGRVLAVAAGHPLAARGAATLEDLADHHVVDLGPDAPEYWVSAMVPMHTPRGRRIARGPVARTFHEILALVADGECVHPLGEIAARYNNPPGIVFLPMPDAPPLRWALVWRSTNDSPAVRALAATADRLGPIAL